MGVAKVFKALICVQSPKNTHSIYVTTEMYRPAFLVSQPILFIVGEVGVASIAFM